MAPSQNNCPTLRQGSRNEAAELCYAAHATIWCAESSEAGQSGAGNDIGWHLRIRQPGCSIGEKLWGWRVLEEDL